MPLSCIHIHTVFCDGKDDIETYCKKAHEKGFASIGFSAHAPIKNKTGIDSSWNMREGDLSLYLEEVREVKKKWADRLKIYLGLEVDFISGLMGPADRDYREMDLDFIIGAVHYVFTPGGKAVTVDNSKENVDRDIKEHFNGNVFSMLDIYYKTLKAMILAGGFDLLAHPDVVKKNNSNSRLFNEDSTEYRAMAAPIVQLTAKLGVPSEINTGGMNRGRITDCYPSPWLLELFHKNGVPMVINSDAHKADELDGHYEEAKNALLSAGYKHSLVFNGRKEGRAVWEKEPL